jgi:hypothetical protein
MAKSALGAALPTGAPTLLSVMPVAAAVRAPVPRPAQVPPELEKFPPLELPPAVDLEEPMVLPAAWAGASWEVETIDDKYELSPCLNALMMQGPLSAATTVREARRPSADLKRKLKAEEDSACARAPPKVARPRPRSEPPELLASMDALELPEACQLEDEEPIEFGGALSASQAALSWSDSEEECFSPAINAWLAAKAATATVEAAGEIEVTWSDEGMFRLEDLKDDLKDLMLPTRSCPRKKTFGSRSSLCSTAAGTPRPSVSSGERFRLDSINDWPGLSF